MKVTKNQFWLKRETKILRDTDTFNCYERKEIVRDYYKRWKNVGIGLAASALFDPLLIPPIAYTRPDLSLLVFGISFGIPCSFSLYNLYKFKHRSDYIDDAQEIAQAKKEGRESEIGLEFL